MGQGTIGRVFPVTMTSGALSSTVADIKRTYNWMYLDVPTMASGDLFIMVSIDQGTTFKRVMRDNLNTTTAHSTFSILSSITQRIVPVPAGFQFYKVESSSGCTDVVTTLRFICGD